MDDNSLPEHIKKLPNALRKKWLKIYNKIYKEEIDNGASQYDADKKAQKEANKEVKHSFSIMTDIPSYDSFITSLKASVDEKNYSEALITLEIFREGWFTRNEWFFEYEIVVTKTDLDQIINNYKNEVIGRELSFNVDHSQSSRAVAWVKDLYLTERNINKKTRSILNALVELTPFGIELLASKEYRYFSVELMFSYMDPETDKNYGWTLIGGSLTNRPFITNLIPAMLHEDSTRHKNCLSCNKCIVFDEKDSEGINNTIGRQKMVFGIGVEPQKITIDEFNQLITLDKIDVYYELFDVCDGEFDNVPEDILEFAKWTKAFINSLPDSSFAAIEPAYKRGEIDDKNARHLPHHDENGGGTSNKNIDMPHLRNAMARSKQIKPITKSITKDALVQMALAHLDHHKDMMKDADHSYQGGDLKLEQFNIEQLTQQISAIDKKITELDGKDENMKTLLLESKNTYLSTIKALEENKGLKEDLGKLTTIVTSLTEDREKLKVQAKELQLTEVKNKLLQEFKLTPAVTNLSMEVYKWLSDIEMIDKSWKFSTGEEAKSLCDMFISFLSQLPANPKMDLSEITRSTAVQPNGKFIFNKDEIDKAVKAAVEKIRK